MSDPHGYSFQMDYDSLGAVSAGSEGPRILQLGADEIWLLDDPLAPAVAIPAISGGQIRNTHGDAEDDRAGGLGELYFPNPALPCLLVFVFAILTIFSRGSLCFI